MSKKEVKLKGVMERSQVVAYLEDLVASLKQGKICVQQGEEFVTLCPDQMLDVEVKASAKKGKEKFEIELVWYREQSREEGQEMKISALQEESSTPQADPLPAVSSPAIAAQQAEIEAPEKPEMPKE